MELYCPVVDQSPFAPVVNSPPLAPAILFIVFKLSMLSSYAEPDYSSHTH